ncbi:HPP family protein [Paucibacter sp. O1-1]|uniref:HPP family protein n=1 Tax=Paucibacter sp. M5-1 TaxID=3015998 RepID=UPI0021D49E36|nr:HPP family protein [Paucibacter sp. M5-1]MCU7370367.1 HPP family protein [Paucibacter sp. O1-1]MCZ7881881.1 HPP family protein [Paucibacter sp. M5-1]MDA3825352.1 HPP family protein [Paucibacter sp. O1-1]
MPSFLARLKRLPASRAPASPPPAFVLWSALGATLAIALTGWLTQASGYPWQMAPFGASCVLAFGLPDSPLAQPRSIVGGHLVASLVGLLVMLVLGDSWWAAGIAVGLALALMQITRTVHAPAGADPLVVFASQAGATFLLTPVLAGSLAIVLVALLVNNLRQRGSYPRYWS